MHEKVKIKQIEGNVVAALGYLANGIDAGMKNTANTKDLSMIYSQAPMVVAGTFTTNQVKAYCVTRNASLLQQKNNIHALVINSKYANVCTGKQGFADNEELASLTAEALHVDPTTVLTASTGIIGASIPMQKVRSALPLCHSGLGRENVHAQAIAQAILTTDTRPKEIAFEFELGGKRVRIGAIAKGSGMINPRMGTMFSFITTDLAISADVLQHALSDSVNHSYNLISVDGDTSTNDMVLVMANGMAKNDEITDTKSLEYAIFKHVLDKMNHYLSQEIIKDGEGATMFLTFEVKRARSYSDAEKIIAAVSNSLLVKTAFFGRDANWGRILASLGSTDAYLEVDKISLFYHNDMGKIQLLEQGEPLNFSEEEAQKILATKQVHITIDLGVGEQNLIGYSCDLSNEYIRINGSYRN